MSKLERICAKVSPSESNQPNKSRRMVAVLVVCSVLYSVTALTANAESSLSRVRGKKRTPPVSQLESLARIPSFKVLPSSGNERGEFEFSSSAFRSGPERKDDAGELLYYRTLMLRDLAPANSDVLELGSEQSDLVVGRYLASEAFDLGAKHILKPALGSLYEDARQALGSFKRNTSFSVRSEKSTGFVVAKGEDLEGKVAELKLHVSPKWGIEPRLKLKDRLLLRFRPFNGEIVAEYRYDF